MRPKTQKSLLFHNKCNCMVDYILLQRAMLWYAGGTLKHVRKIYMHGNYPAVSMYKTKIHIHRLLICYLHNNKKLKGVVHHKDGNKLNSNVSNLELTTQKNHIRKHLKGRTQSYGSKFKRIKASCLARYGHENINIHQNEELLK